MCLHLAENYMILGWSLGPTQLQPAASQANQNLLTHSDLELASAKYKDTVVACHPWLNRIHIKTSFSLILVTSNTKFLVIRIGLNPS